MSSIDVKIITSPSQRGKSTIANAVTSSNEVVELMVVEDFARIENKIEPGTYVKFLQYNTQEEPNKKRIKLHRKTKIFTIKPFDVDATIEQHFFNAPHAPIDEALNMQSNKRVSLKGIAQNISPVKEGPSSRRNELVLKDPQTSSSIRCKLWGKFADSSIASGTLIDIHNVEVSHFESMTTINTTPESTVNELTRPPTRDYIITGFDIDSEPTQIVTTTDLMFNISADLLQKLADNDISTLTDKLPLACTIQLDLKTNTVIGITPKFQR
ncbi:uncharacterized protein LOC119733833 [Patiria miniata]|uniref:Replication protein A OB domain-containing protein n=1 Tax=Patiria miniata TaxID=46514 RepID=A0A914AGL8_PATMI|nr:uncharacterized protein LOC119733833 [Patiria miniata]